MPELVKILLVDYLDVIECPVDDQGRPSSQCHRAMALVVFCPALNFRAYIEYPVTKRLETPNWHWLILSPMGALVHLAEVLNDYASLGNSLGTFLPVFS